MEDIPLDAESETGHEKGDGIKVPMEAESPMADGLDGKADCLHLGTMGALRQLAITTS